MFCENCGRELEDDVRFCPDCGRQVHVSGQKSARHQAVPLVLAVVLLIIAGALAALYGVGRSIESNRKRDDSADIVSVETESIEKIESDSEKESKTETEKKSDPYQVYYEKIKKLQKTYGTGQIAELTFSEYLTKDGWKGKYLRGVCFAKLEDFDADGQEELITAYLNPENEPYGADVAAIKDYVIEVWKYRDLTCEKIFDAELYLPHQGMLDEAVFLTNVEGIPYFVQGHDDVYYGFWGYGADGFQERMSLENDWIEQTGCRIDGVQVSNSEYEAVLEKWWKGCDAYQFVDFCNSAVSNNFTLKAEKLAAAGSLEKTLAELADTLNFLSKEVGIDETETEQKETAQTETQQKSTVLSETGKQSTFQTETTAAAPQVTMSCVSSIEASSVLEENTITHYAENICDGDVGTAWVESASGQGLGEFVCINFDGTYGIDGIRLYAGYQKSEDLYKKNSRPSELEIKFFDGTLMQCILEDFLGEQIVEFPERKETSWIMLTIEEVYQGSKYEDTCIAELEFY